ncbi:adenylyltransferase/cytidyltransferase family protein [Veillonella parvula]|uniref:adenylyltransferase/cytidyltransferase family protein n=1 Tax=Veillonella parvula TaxID=29466 RepID=UPI002904100F|nr:adenylyltransferase/cytidyltransferase family protein [Veillonella parvula]MDU3191566.1 adenylyltransferase/cytidyltransferase family protein [Veillonella parvula]
MVKVITYGTYDLFHEGHYNLLKNAKALGDYLIVGVTSDYFDKSRGKFNVRDSLMTRIDNVRATGFADEIVVEEYFGQKIDDIKRFNVDIFTVGSDWEGYFDYLNEYCKVVYLPRTQGISSTHEAKFVSGIDIIGGYTETDAVDTIYKSHQFNDLEQFSSSKILLDEVDAVYINMPLSKRVTYIEKALQAKKHVLTEFPFSSDLDETLRLMNLAKSSNLVLMEGLKTAYSPAFSKLIAMARSGQIGKIFNVEANFTQVLGDDLENQVRIAGGSILSLAAYPLLAIFKLLGFDYNHVDFISHKVDDVDILSKINFLYDDAMASATVAINAKAEGDLVISGSKGYIYVPAPWWKTEFFELRFEDVNLNRKYFYKFEGEGLRYEIVEFLTSIRKNSESFLMSHQDMIEEVRVLDKFVSNTDVTVI